MRWLTVRIDTNHAGLEPVTAMLSAMGEDSVMIEDETEFHEFLEQNRESWDYVDENLKQAMRGRSRVTFYLPESESGFARLAEIRIALRALREANPARDYGELLMTLENMDSADWENNWKRYYQPIEIGERLLIIPEWEYKNYNYHAPDNNNNNIRGRIPVVLDPGLAFGTGGHATTRMCLELLEPCVWGGERVLDLGCGSGILSIAALLLGAESAVAVDIDEVGVRVARSNAALNGFYQDDKNYHDQNHPNPGRYTAFTGNIFDILSDEARRNQAGIHGQYEIILANIVADVIIRLAPMIPGILSPDGYFLCSGVIDNRHEEVEESLRAAGFAIALSRESGGWYAYRCTADKVL